jgi:hypothetical protein
MNNVARKHRVLGLLLLLLLVAFAAVLITLRLVSPDGGTSGVGGTRGIGDGTGGVGDWTRGIGDGNSDVADGAGLSSFTISGSTAKPVSPGVMAPLDLIFTNPNDVAMSVTDLSVTVRKVSAPNADDAHPCVVGDFTVAKASGSIKITVAARATSALSSLGLARATWPHVGLLDGPANQDGCKGASLTLGYAASGTLAQ